MEKSRLTAYALNEVSEAERVEIEKYLESHPSERAEIEEIKLVSSILKSEMAADLVLTAPKIKKKKSLSFSFLWQPRTLGLVISLGFIGLVSMQLVKQSIKDAPVPSTTQNLATLPPPPPPAAKDQVADFSSDTSSGSLAGNAAPTTNAAAAPEAQMLGASGVPTAVKSKTSLVATFGAKDSAPRARPAKGEQIVAAESESRTWVQGQKDSAEGTSNEEYKLKPENDIVLVSKEPLSTFSIDVDTASYTNARRYLNSYDQIPPLDSIRTEEFVNYFEYEYSAPTTGHPIAVHMEAVTSPWNTHKTIVRVGLKAKEISPKDRPKSNLVFLIDVSGSMSDENKLPLVKSALRTLSEQLNDNDRISMVVYAGQSGVVLDGVKGNNKEKILNAIQQLSSGGSTNGEGGIRKAYDMAQKNYISGGNNRVILASDGDFNVGVTSSNELLKIIKEKSEGGVFLTVLGFGMGNYKDARMEEISNKGQGNYFYIDNAKEADKVFVNQLMGTLLTVAKDVKVQVEFNPKLVTSYRLVGYENRTLQKEDFNNDKIDAGEMGAGHSVTALYEIEMKENRSGGGEPFSNEILTAKIRYKKPLNSSSEYFDQPLKNTVTALENASCSTRFAIAVASFSQWLRKSDHVKGMDASKILKLSESCVSTGGRKDSYKEEFISLVKKARSIRK